MGSFTSLLKWALGTLFMVAFGVFVIRKVPFLNALVFGASA